jgi:NADPH:quinone reductase-like Zn-dependent oxidoreductase
MRAIVQSGYGLPEDVLALADVPIPDVGDDEVLVRVQAASMHPDVWHVVRGRPYALRIMGSGLRKPKNRVPGIDAAGQVESIGTNVTRFQPGDEVFGETVRGHQWKNGGAFAEYVSVPEQALAMKPANLTLEQAAAVPTSALIAHQGIRDEGHVQAGQKVLINGAGGGVGVFAVQLAKAYGADVTAVDGTGKLDMLRSIGADHVIDYTKEDFTLGGMGYDLILDIPGNRSFSDLQRVLGDGGTYALIGHEDFDGGGGRWIGRSMVRFIKLLVRAPFGRPEKGKATPPKTKDPLNVLKDFIEAGKLIPVIDRTFPLGQVPEAIRHLESGQSVGKIVITV